LNVSGLHEFIRAKVAEFEKTDAQLCHIVDAHYFKGRMRAGEASEKRLFAERVFEDVLMYEGITTHYLPLTKRADSYFEKGVDVWLALEAFELSMYKRFNVVVLIASDGDFTPLIRKLTALGIKVMLVYWDFERVDENGERKVIRTSQSLIYEATYPLAMHAEIDNRAQENQTRDLFSEPKRRLEYGADGGFLNESNGYVSSSPYGGSQTAGLTGGYSSNYSLREPKERMPIANPNSPFVEAGSKDISSSIQDLKDGYGFIYAQPNNVFFHYSNVMGEFDDLQVGDKVKFDVELGQRGLKAVNVERLVGSEFE